MAHNEGEANGLFEDRSTKKVHLKDQQVESIVLTMGVSTLASIMSWKEKLIGGSSVMGNESEVLALEMESDLEFVEEDIMKSTINGIPSID
ncbi:hypothetical protein J1N35_004958 [Gossypium stocksii]|uniref:Uncharacterized protein n=1 Tax=Gossypium stocksii TaxID=47602 RepID=A0A9D3WDQ0_9ROSI|nr:hypothetical protein J1N35_004958 [Gossypium stocksii]